MKELFNSLTKLNPLARLVRREEKISPPEQEVMMPPWKHRRRLIYATCMLAVGMIVFAAATYKTDTQVASQLIIGGVALLSITLTGYTAFATYQDTKLWNPQQPSSGMPPNLNNTQIPNNGEDFPLDDRIS